MIVSRAIPPAVPPTRLAGGELYGPPWFYARDAINSANDISRPPIALAATVGGLASHTLPGPERPGKLRLMALTVTWSADVDEPGPQPAHAPHDGCRSSAPTRSNASR